MANAIDKFPVPLILKKILKDRMSGELIVLHDDSTRELFFVDGQLEFATTTIENECLGDVLLEAGKINKDQLRLALDIRSNVPTKIGEILAKTCDLTMRDIFDGLVKHVMKIAAALFPLKRGEWRFVKKNPKIPNTQKLKIKLTEIMREGVNELEDFSFYKQKFYFRSPVTIDLPKGVEKILTDEESKLYKKLGRFNNISVKKIIPILQVPEPVFWRSIILFYLLNAADFVEFTVDDEEQNKKIAEINEMYQKIKSGQSDYFQLLQSDKIASVEEANERFNEISDRFDPGKLNVAPDSTAMRRAREVFEEIHNAHRAIRRDIEKKSEERRYPAEAAAVGRENEPSIESIIDEKIRRPSEINVNREYEPPLKAGIDTKNRQAEKPEVRKADQVKQARELFTRANHFHNEKKYFEAASLLQQAVVMDNSKADYFLLLGLCQSKMPATKKMAEKSLKKAARMESWNADPVFALGQLYKSENLMKKAKVYFEKALELNLDHTLAGKAMYEFRGNDKKSLFSLFGKKK
jgi:tetratricopeptide (TPR) repeat protein